MQHACPGNAAKTKAASAALTSFGVRGKRHLEATAHDWARSVVKASPGAVSGHELSLVAPGGVDLNNECGVTLLRAQLAAITGAAHSATPGTESAAAAAEYGARLGQLCAPAKSTASRRYSWDRRRGAGRCTVRQAAGGAGIIQLSAPPSEA